MVQRDQAFSVRDIFNLDAPADFTTAGFSDAQNPHLPKRNDDYVFRRETMRDILTFLDDPDGDGMFFAEIGRASCRERVSSHV